MQVSGCLTDEQPLALIVVAVVTCLMSLVSSPSPVTRPDYCCCLIPDGGVVIVTPMTVTLGSQSLVEADAVLGVCELLRHSDPRRWAGSVSDGCLLTHSESAGV